MSETVRAIKGRIQNIENIRQITKAMNAIAMTKVTRMKRRVVSVRPYLEEIESFLARLLGEFVVRIPTHPLTADNGSPYVGVLVLNADRGLCGRFKGDLNRKGEEVLAGLDRRGRLLVGGEKARVHFARRPVEILKTYSRLYEEPTAEAAHEIASDLISFYRETTLGRVVLVYMQFVSDLAQRVVVEDLLPLRVEGKEGLNLIEPDPAAVLEYAVPLYLEARVFRALLETKTSEHAIRRQAMKSATDNADDLLTLLTRSFNKARQQSITREIADIIGGAEALREG
jgi:F-type H+-transporting ATPase subunit gamma